MAGVAAESGRRASAVQALADFCVGHFRLTVPAGLLMVRAFLDFNL